MITQSSSLQQKKHLTSFCELRACHFATKVLQFIVQETSEFKTVCRGHVGFMTHN